jgi:hypothetical protein
MTAAFAGPPAPSDGEAAPRMAEVVEHAAGVDRLLVETQRRLESLYALEHAAPVTEFLIAEADAAAYPGDGSRTLVTQHGDEISLAVVLAGSVSEHLARCDPRERLDASNLAPFCTLAEEVSHFVYLLFRARSERPITAFELELQGEIDKYLSVVMLSALQNEGAVSSRIGELLFRRYTLAAGLSADVAERYHTANRMAARYCDFLERQFLRERRVSELARESRRFYRLGQREKLERIAALQ